MSSVKGKERARDDVAESSAQEGAAAPAGAADGTPSDGAAADMDISDEESHDAEPKVPDATLALEQDALDPVWLRKPRPPIPSLLRSLDQVGSLALGSAATAPKYG